MGPPSAQTSGTFQVVAPFEPAGDQPAAIDDLVARIDAGARHTCLLGATGTGKTFTMAHTIMRLGKPTLIISHNKTLAAQLYEELREFLPHNSVNYFVSYYDYYQPEAYIPQRDIYIEKDASRNDDLDQLRLAATSNILSRRDSVVVCSVSCIFGLGSPEAFGERILTINRGDEINRRSFFLALNDMQYKRKDTDPERGCYRVRGDCVEIWPANERFAVRLDLFGDEIDRLDLIDPTSGELLAEESQFFLFPAVHYVMPEDELQPILDGIKAELDERVMQLRSQGRLLEAQRLLARTRYDLEMIQEVGYCSGIENYSRWFDRRREGEKPFTLLDYFDYAPPAGEHKSVSPMATELSSEKQRGMRPNLDDWLLIIDESHVTLPQVRAMFNGDQARKKVLVEHGFRLSSALDNRPLRFEEFEAAVPQVLYVSATPGPYELEKCSGLVTEQIIRPTGLLDPEIEIKPARGQIEDLVQRCKDRVADGQRVLVTALTKRLCEDLTRYLDEQGLRVRYLHSDIETLERVEILTDLREGVFDVLVGVNLLREGLDLPEVSLVCILDADKAGFLRSATSLIQQMGRAARNVDAQVVMYADAMTPAMQAAIEETERRRERQLAYNAEHGITPETIRKGIRRGLETQLKARKTAREAVAESEEQFEASELLAAIERDMLESAEKLEFERAAHLRDQAKEVKRQIDAGEASGKVRRSEIERKAADPLHKPGMPGSKGKRRKPKPRG
jgi:excinuclease ABC subunit B